MKTLMKITVLLVIATACQAREVLKEITQNTRLNGNLVYYVDDPPLLIHGQIEVIIPSGTMIVVKENFSVPAIRIYDEAIVSVGLSKGITGPFDFPQQSDSNSLVRPVLIIGESGLPFNNNYCGILVERTASSSCFFNNIVLQGFGYGLIVDKPLASSIYSIYVMDCWNGIQSYGSNTIENSYVANYGLDADPDYTGYAYDFYAHSRDGNVVYDGATYSLHHCLANDGGYAFNGHGLDASYTSPTLSAYDCASTSNHSGFNLFDGSIGYSFLCSGIYNNDFDKNYDDIILDYPIYTSNNPIVTKSGDYRIFLDPNSDFVDGGDSIISNSGWSTRSDGKPDDGWSDIWLSYQTKSWSGLKADLNNDGVVDINDLSLLVDSWLITNESKKADIDRSEFVDFYDLSSLFDHWLMESSNIDNLAGEPIINFEDFAVLAKSWLKTAIYPVNINSDGICNFVDFSILADEWLKEDMKVGIVNLDNPDSFNFAAGQTVSGGIGISIFNPPPSTSQFTVYVDNIFIGTYSPDVVTNESWVTIPTQLFCNGWHDIKVSTTDVSGNNINHKPLKIFFDNLISNVCTTKFFSSGSSKIFLGFNDGNNPLNVEVKDWRNGSVLWSQLVSGDSVNLQIPGSTFTGQMFVNFSISPSSGALMAEAKTTDSKEVRAASAGSSSSSYADVYWPDFDIANYPAGIRVIILCPDLFVGEKFAPAIAAWLNCFLNRGIPANKIAIISYLKVNETNLKLAFWNGGFTNRKYGLYFGHGNSMAGNVQRSFIEAWKLVGSEPPPMGMDCLIYKKTYAFSYTHGAVPLPGNWDDEGIDLSSLYLNNNRTMEQMWMFGCRLGQYSDMAWAFGAFSDWNAGTYDQIYGGFNCDVLGSSSGILDTLIKGVVNGSVTMAQSLGQHKTVWKAFEDIQASGSRQQYWGINGVMDIAEPDSDDNFIPWGYGQMDAMKIEP